MRILLLVVLSLSIVACATPPAIAPVSSPDPSQAATPSPSPSTGPSIADDGVIEEMVGTDPAPEDPDEEFIDDHEGEVDEAFHFDFDALDLSEESFED